MIDRRTFISRVAGGFSVPVAAAAQQPQQSRRLGVIIAVGQTPEYIAALSGFEQVLSSLGWRESNNILAQSSAVVEALISLTRTTPIVFLHVPDPVGSGFVSSMARPGGNVTGITNIDPSIGGKWLQLVKEIAPAITRSALLVNPDTQPDRGAIFLNPFEAAARSMGVRTSNGEVRDFQDIERVIAGLATEPRGGVVVTPDAFFATHSSQLVALAGRLQVPVMYPYRYYVAAGGLLCYGVNNVDLFRQAAPYADRLLRGAKPADLPVQQPTRFDLVVNAKTAKSLGLTIPQSVLARADEVIQ